MDTVVLTLPMCPTTNNLFAGTGKKRVKTYKYEAWEQEAGWELLRQRPPRIKGPVAVTIEVSDLDSSSTWDLCNREKATMDLLVTHGVIQGDNKPIVREFNMRWSAAIRGVRVTVQPLAPQSVNDVLLATAERLEAAQ
jgi:Holliday junction resolvase RusA-like endonuclease